MGHHKERYLAKVRKQLVNKQENERFYQNGSRQKSPRSDRERTEDRTISDPA